jgi:ribosomal protein S18 acetylase RimI-like enzyme
MPNPLRAARAGDAEAIAILHTDSWRRTYRGMMTDEFLDGGALANRQRVWRERLGGSDPRQFVCVAEDGPGIVGFICAFADHDPIWGSYIDNLHVAYGRQRRGLGRALMREVAGWLDAVQPDTGVWLWVMEANTPARGFYDRLGARNAETVDVDDPGGGRAPNCRYVWAAPGALLSARDVG